MAAVWLASGRRREHRHSPGDMFGAMTHVYEIVGTDAAAADVDACWDRLYRRAVAILEDRWDAVGYFRRREPVCLRRTAHAVCVRSPRR
jgi:hypothetical protein